MNIIEAIRNRILKFLKLDKLTYNPDSERFTFINNEANIQKRNLEAYRIWYVGDSDELLNFYTNSQLYGNAEEPIYNRNKRNYFWGLSSVECDIKRVHSGIPNAIVTTLTNAIGIPKITSANEDTKNIIDEIIQDNNFEVMLNQEVIPMTLALGYGAIKVIFDKRYNKTPKAQYYEAQDIEYVYKANTLIGIIFKDYYQYKNKNYLLLETRRITETDSIVEYELFKLNNDNDVEPVELSTIPELEGLRSIVIPNYHKILAVPVKFFYDPLNKNYGRSIFAGKIDLFDDLDQILSQDSQTVRVSTPVEYYPVDLLERDKFGNARMPKAYNRQFIKKDSIANGDGDVDGTIQTTQPVLNFDQYSQNAKAKLDFVLTGILSPATMGIDIAKKDNADAQREKEKVTIMTRNNVIKCLSKSIKDFMEIELDMKEYMDTGFISEITDYEINVVFNEFANPSFENEAQILSPLWENGAISTEKYVDLLWGDKLSDEEKKKEVAWLDNNRQKDNMPLGAFEDENEARTIIPTEEENNFEIDKD